MKSAPFKIAIVGLGPKGLYGFERILAQVKANPVTEKVEIHLFNKTRFMGSGNVYRSDQPDYLLMNFANSYINMWTKESPSPVVKCPLRLSEYIALEEQKPLEEIEPLYASRATVGRYLENGFAQLSRDLPDNVILKKHIAEVRSIEKVDDTYSIVFLQREKSCELTGFQQILIATGHQRHENTVKTDHATVPFIYPVQQNLNEVTKRDTVAVKRMGLTFIDAVLALTEGRGGFFKEASDGKLIYKASGREPKQIFPFSKSGWPMLPKYDFNLNDGPEIYVERLKLLKHKKLNLKCEILPLIEQDIEYAYYKTIFSHEGEVLQYHPNYDEVTSQIDTFHQKHSGYLRFSLERLINPEFDPAISNHQNILQYLSAFSIENGLSIECEAQLRAASVWRRISPVFNEIYSFSGLDAASHQEFDSYYFEKLNRIAYGPPPGKLKKILALANAGIVNFQFAKNPNVEPLESGFILSNSISEIYCDVLIDGCIPKKPIDKEATGLFANLCENQLAQPYINSDEKFSYAPGTLQINRNGNLINPRGIPENITLYGTPTESTVHDNATLSGTCNNFADSWACLVISQLMNDINEISKQHTHTFAYSE